MTKDEFIEKRIKGWIKKDLERMTTEIKAGDGEYGAINLPLALCTLAYIEYLGSFLTGDDFNEELNLKTYIEHCFNEHCSEYPVPILKDIFRNSLAHDYFPRGAISREGLRPGVYKQGEHAILDVDTMIEDFLKSLDVFSSILTEEQYTTRMDIAKLRTKESFDKHSLLIEVLPVRVYIDNLNIRGSLASTSPIPMENLRPLTIDKKAD